MRDQPVQIIPPGFAAFWGAICVFWGAFAHPAQALESPTIATEKPVGRDSVYVGEWAVAPEIRLSGRALEIALCVHLIKDQRIDSQCESDVAEMLKFSAESALAGNETSALAQLVHRIQENRWLLLGQVTALAANGWRLSLTAYEKGEASTGVHLIPGAAVATVELEVPPDQQAQVLTLVPGLSDELIRKLTGPESLQRLPPPAPLSAPPVQKK